MANDPDLDRLVAQAEAVMRAEGSAERLQDVGPDDWERLLDGLADRAARDGTRLPEDWRQTLGTYRDREQLRSDADDVRLAEEGEVFSREDDA